MTPCLTDSGRPTWVGLLFILVLVMAACTAGGADDTAEEATIDPSERAETAQALAAFATYRAGVQQADADAVIGNITQASIVDQERLVDLARTADTQTIRDLPATDQLTVLTYRLSPGLLEADDPFRAYVEGGFAGQDRSLGELGDLELATDELILGEIVDAATGRPAGGRWRFNLEQGEWRFDLVDANAQVSQAIAASAERAGKTVDEVVVETLVRLSGEDQATIEALQEEPPAST